MNEETMIVVTTMYIHGDLLHKHSVTFNQVMVATI